MSSAIVGSNTCSMIGLLGLSVAVGCYSSSAPTDPVDKETQARTKNPQSDQSHRHSAPHGGQIVDLGHGEYHAELVQNDAAGRVIVYVLDSSAQTSVLEKATDLKINTVNEGKPKQFKLSHEKTTGKEESYFAIESRELLNTLRSPGVTLRVTTEISGKSYTGSLNSHSHPHDDALVWLRKEIEYASFSIGLGYHGKRLQAGTSIEPAVTIAKNGQPVENATVSVSLVGDSGTVVVTEMLMIYEPPTPEEPAHYAQAKPQIPAHLSQITLRYHICVPSVEVPVIYDVPVRLK